jgi:hypothetical protein
MAGNRLPTEKFLDGQPDVARDFAQERRRNVAPGMEGNGRSASVGMAVLTMRTALADFGEPQAFKQRHDLARAEDRNRSHRQATWIV